MAKGLHFAPGSPLNCSNGGTGPPGTSSVQFQARASNTNSSAFLQPKFRLAGWEVHVILSSYFSLAEALLERRPSFYHHSFLCGWVLFDTSSEVIAGSTFGGKKTLKESISVHPFSLLWCFSVVPTMSPGRSEEICSYGSNTLKLEIWLGHIKLMFPVKLTKEKTFI